MSFKPSLFSFVILFAAASAQAREHHGSEHAHIDPNSPLAQLSLFEGEWHAQDSDSTDPNAVAAQLHVHPVVGGSWLAFKWKSQSEGVTYEALALAGYDPVQGIFVEHDISNGGAYGNSVSHGWSGDVLTWNGLVNNWGGKQVYVQKSYQKVDSAHIAVEIDVSDDGKTWSTLHQLTLVR